MYDRIHISAPTRAAFRKVEAALLDMRGSSSVTEPVRPARYAKKVFYIHAVQVTAENMDKVAQWCGGVIEYTRAKPEKQYPSSPFVKLNTHNPRDIRHTRAFVGDWVVRADNDERDIWRIYTNQAFRLAFEEVEDRESVYVTK